MREIKFRGKRIDADVWVYGDLVHCCPGDCYIGKIGAIEGRNVRFVGEICDPKTVGQLTGLRDKNGKEIYEGDILDIKLMDGNEIFRVVYDDRRARFHLYDNEGVGWSFDHTNEYEVIGNIYEHPHLLEGGGPHEKT
ncbi:YopX family protein [Paenibacillus sp.]|uniref:YopX family protein n=1 Tax=Paenibacillus sp. TaxID=58172 RepID=UPI002D71EFFE|nr:YopX family protein [Paenibacillus sp.]HZG83849.1 YopX family protein [Paenibacillus sp.]